MHSSRMHIAHLLPVSFSMHCSRGYLAQGVCTWSGGCTWFQGGTWSGEVCLARGCTWSWECTWSGGVPTQVLAPVDRMTDMCKNLAFANFVCGRKKLKLCQLKRKYSCNKSHIYIPPRMLFRGRNIVPLSGYPACFPYSW